MLNLRMEKRRVRFSADPSKAALKTDERDRWASFFSPRFYRNNLTIHLMLHFRRMLHFHTAEKVSTQGAMQHAVQ